MLRFEVIGNLGSDAEIKSEGGRTYVQFSVADTRKFKKDDGTEVEKTNWVSCFMSRTDSAIIPYLKKGVKVFVRGTGDLRIYSSEKERCMKAGASINVSEIELCGGSAADDVPRSLATSEGTLLNVFKCFFVDPKFIPGGTRYLYDTKGRRYDILNTGQIVAPADGQAQGGQSNTEQNQTGQN